MQVHSEFISDDAVWCSALQTPSSASLLRVTWRTKRRGLPRQPGVLQIHYAVVTEITPRYSCGRCTLFTTSTSTTPLVPIGMWFSRCAFRFRPHWRFDWVWLALSGHFSPLRQASCGTPAPSLFVAFLLALLLLTTWRGGVKRLRAL